MKNQKKAYVHGECFFVESSLPSDCVPENLQKITVSDKGSKYVIVADSEVTGNHHVVDMKEGVEFFLNSKGTRFVKNNVPTDIRCLIGTRHSTVTLPPGTWQLGIQKEFDYFAMAKRNVRD
jgi:hypothetical protein